MSGINDFVIVNGLLKEHRGTREDVVIPDSVTSIGESAFECCESLESVIIQASVKSIGNNAFKNCTRLTSDKITNSVDE